MKGSWRIERLDSLSIKARIRLINLLLLVFIGLYALYAQYNAALLQRLDQAIQLNHQSEVDLLSLRRNEKDFLLRQTPKYLDQHQEVGDRLSGQLTELSAMLTDLELADPTTINTIKTDLAGYQNEFSRLVRHTQAIEGTATEPGLKPAVEMARSALNDAVANTKDFELELSAMALFLSELQFSARPTTDALTRFSALLDQFAQHQRAHPDLSEALLHYQQAAEHLIRAYRTYGLTPQEGIRGALRQNAHAIETSLLALNQNLHATIDGRLEANRWRQGVVGLVIALLLSAILGLVGKSIVRRIVKLRDSMCDIASGSGDLTARINERGNDELAQLAQAFDTFVSQLHGHIVDIDEVMTTLSQSSEQSHQSARQSLDNTEQQKRESEGVEVAITHLSSSNQEIAASLHDTAQAALQIQQASQTALTLTHDSSSNIETLAQNIGDTQVLVSQLEAQSREINKIVTTIQTISEQTNLLALNAAIEAARAGEYGRGFAVVADEVRQLSQKTNQSTTQIDQTISDLTQNIDNTVCQMSSSLTQAQTSTANMSQVVDAIERITDQINEVSDKHRQIAAASEEHAQATKEIDSKVVNISHLAGCTYTAVSGSVADSEQVASVSQKLKQILSAFRY
ncbi:methyl-accepting chemotaxis protein [Marinobacter hydrocarbonoclasticus]|nr:methyl-accepting chemotaxis protein [Marinobacter nauticus]